MTQTVTAFYGALNSLVVTGVRRRYAYEPNGLSTADLPAQWVRLPGAALGVDSGYASACNDTSKERTRRTGYRAWKRPGRTHQARPLPRCLRND
jgi:hypothetical protein